MEIQNLYTTEGLATMLERLSRLRPDSPRHWGTMNPAQMMAHCSMPLKSALGENPAKAPWFMQLIGKLIKPMILTKKPFQKNSPTDRSFIIPDERDFLEEKQRLTALIKQFSQRGKDQIAFNPHPIFGKLSYNEWNLLTYKHLDHHFRQFGV